MSASAAVKGLLLLTWALLVYSATLGAGGVWMACTGSPLVGIVMIADAVYNGRIAIRALRKHRARQDVRPRFGMLHRADGAEELVVFHPGDQPGMFVALHAGDERMIVLRRGDAVSVDDGRFGQSVTLVVEESR